MQGGGELDVVFDPFKGSIRAELTQVPCKLIHAFEQGNFLREGERFLVLERNQKLVKLQGIGNHSAFNEGSRAKGQAHRRRIDRILPELLCIPILENLRQCRFQQQCLEMCAHWA